MPKSKSHRKNKKVKQSINKQNKKLSSLEKSPNSDCLAYLIREPDDINFGLFIKELFSQLHFTVNNDIRDWFDTFDFLLNENRDFILNVLKALYYQEKSDNYHKFLHKAVNIMSEEVLEDCSINFIKATLELDTPVDNKDLSTYETIELKIYCFTVQQLLSIVKELKKVYKALFFDELHNEVVVKNKIANF